MWVNAFQIRIYSCFRFSEIFPAKHHFAYTSKLITFNVGFSHIFRQFYRVSFAIKFRIRRTCFLSSKHKIPPISGFLFGWWSFQSMFPTLDSIEPNKDAFPNCCGAIKLQFKQFVRKFYLFKKCYHFSIKNLHYYWWKNEKKGGIYRFDCRIMWNVTYYFKWLKSQFENKNVVLNI